jgi:hypothetical protein
LREKAAVRRIILPVLKTRPTKSFRKNLSGNQEDKVRKKNASKRVPQNKNHATQSKVTLGYKNGYIGSLLLPYYMFIVHLPYYMFIVL